MNNVKGLKGMILCALFAALMAVCSWITIPYVVPFTMQTFAVFVALDLLGWRGWCIWRWARSACRCSRAFRAA